MGAHSTDVDTTHLWKQARRKFEASNPKADPEFLRLEDPKGVTKYLRGKKHKAVRKSNRCGPIVERLEVIFGIGDLAMNAAPESVHLVWAGFRLVFHVILSDSQMCSALVDIMDFFSEVVLVCQIYGKRYLSRALKDSPVKEEVLKRIPKTLSTVLEFSYLVHKFFKPSSDSTRVIRNLFTGTNFKLRDTMEKSKMECEALMKIDDAGFKEEMRRGSEQLQKVMDGLSKSLMSKLDHLNEEIMRLKEQGDESKVGEDIRRNIQWFQSGHIADQDLPRARHGENLAKRQDKSCDWIFDKQVTEYQAWINSEKLNSTGQHDSAYDRMLWLHGDGGVGKSVLVSTVISEHQDIRKHLVVYFFCKLGDEWSQNGLQIMLHLCLQLFLKGSDRDVDMQREFNRVMDEVRDGLRDSDREGASNIPMSTIRSLFRKLAKSVKRDVTIAVDGLDECVENASKFLHELKVLAKSKAKIRVLVSSRSSPDSADIPSILIDKSRTENGIRAYVEAKMRPKISMPGWAIDKIVEKSEGRFRFATIVTDGLQSTTAGVRSLKSRMKGLPDTMNDLYLQMFCLLKPESQVILITVLRWLICRGDRIELLPIADELAQKYGPEEYSDDSEDSDSGFPILSEVARDLAEICRDFVKVSMNVVQLDHNSVRDFVEFRSQRGQIAGKVCPGCGNVDPVGILSEVTGKQGKLIMAEYMLRTINSTKFQKEFILLGDLNSKPNGSEKPSESDKRPMRYEAAHWYKHLREAEAAWPTIERDSEPRWKTLYEMAERFLSYDSKVYHDWLVRKDNIKGKIQIHDSPLYTAARYGLEGLVERYLGSEPKCDVNFKNRNQRTPLLTAFHFWAKKGVTRHIKILLDKEADPNPTDNRQRSCLHYAAQSHSIDACESLLPEADREVSTVRANLKDHHGETPLHWACKSNAPEGLIKFLLDRGADLKVRDKEQQTPLYEACRVGNEDVVRLFLENGADIHDKDFKGDTALHEAVYSGNLSLVKFLTTRKDGAKIDVQNDLSQTPLALAASSNKWEILFFLLDWHKRAKGNMDILLQPDSRGETPLSLAVTAKNLVAVQKLLDKKRVGDTVAQKMCRTADFDKNQPLHRAASLGSAEICRFLIDRGAPTDEKGQTNAYGSTPLDAAFKSWQEWSGNDASRLKEFEDTVEVILSKTSNVAGKHRKLICAIWRGSVRVCERLKTLMNRKDHDRDRHGWIHAVIGASYGNKEIAENLSNSESDKDLVTQLLLGEVPSEPHGHKPSKWSTKNKHDALTLSEKDTVASFTSSDDSIKEAAVVANHPVPAGVSNFYYEVKIEKVDNEGGDSAKVGIGFCSELAYYNSIPGSRAAKAPSWGYHGDTGKLFTRFDDGHKYKNKSGSTRTRPFKAGDTVGCGIDYTPGLGQADIFYTVNGKLLGTAFERVSGRLFPVVGAKSEGWKMKVNFGKEPFEWKDGNKE